MEHESVNPKELKRKDSNLCELSASKLGRGGFIAVLFRIVAAQTAARARTI
jgi:hypothetical protein